VSGSDGSGISATSKRSEAEWVADKCDEMQPNVDRLAQLAAEQGLTLLFHPFVDLVVNVRNHDVWSPDDEDEDDDSGGEFADARREDDYATYGNDDGDHRFLAAVLDDERVLAVVCSVQIQSGLAAGDDFPRSFTPLELVGRPFAELVYRRWRAPYIQVHGTAACLADIDQIDDGWVTFRDMPSERVARATPDASMAAYARELKQHEQQQAEFRRQAAARRAADGYGFEARRNLEQQAWKAEVAQAQSARASRLAEVEATHGRLVLRVLVDEGDVVEIRQNPAGEVESSQWSSIWTSWVDDAEPVAVDRYASLGECLQTMLSTLDEIVTLETTHSMEELEAILVAAEVGEFDFVLGTDDLTFTGEVLVGSGFFHARTLAETEEWLDVSWSFHAGIEGPRWVREVYECIGSTNGVFYYIARIDEQGSMTMLGRLSVDEALEKGKAIAVRDDDERRELLDEDEDAEDEDDEDQDDDDEDDEAAPRPRSGPRGRSCCSGLPSRPRHSP
jgi:hypothetical protein